MPDELKQVLPFLSRAYNIRWGLSGTNAQGKQAAQYRTIRETLPESVLLDHFNGKTAVSVQPLLDDGQTCQWGAIDIDSYGNDGLVREVSRAVELFGIPGVVEPSKSKGAHVYIFLDRPVLAAPFRKALKKLAVWVGHPNAEIRPAQDSIRVEEHDVGSFMVLPFYGAGVTKAIEVITANIVTVEDFNKLTEEGDLIDGPACLFPLQRIAEATEWKHRNNFLYQLGVFLRYKYPLEWKDRLATYNSEVISPSLSEAEVSALVGQLEKNAKCHYICNREPFDAYCNKAGCQLRKYGVAARESFAGLISPEGITVLDTDPPTWFVSLQNPLTQETARVKLTTAQLQSVQQFKKRVLEVLKIVPTLPTQKEWEVIVSKLLESAEVVPVPFEMTENARILDLLYRFCLTSAKSTKFEALLRGRVVVEKSDLGMLCRFRLVDFINFLDRYRYTGVATKDLYATLQDLNRAEKIRLERIALEPLNIEVWALDLDSQYLTLKTELDLEDEIE